MASLPAIYTIRATDALKPAARLQEILQNLKNESRIADFTMLGADKDLSSLTDTIEEEDLILILLTNQLELHKEQIENRFRDFKTNRPEVRIAEIIIDNVPYENAFITFPADLRPIRDREDLDDVWYNIEQSLKDMFPAEKKQQPEERSNNKRLDAVEKHPEYPALLKVRPKAVYLYGRYVFLMIFGLIFTFIAMFFITVTPPDGGFMNDFAFFWTVISLFFVVVGAGMSGYGIFRLLKLSFTSLNRLPALIVDKRIAVRGGGESSPASTSYYVTLEFGDSERQEFEARAKLYGKITKDDIGVAYIRDRYLLDYQRLVINAKN